MMRIYRQLALRWATASTAFTYLRHTSNGASGKLVAEAQRFLRHLALSSACFIREKAKGADSADGGTKGVVQRTMGGRVVREDAVSSSSRQATAYSNN